MSLQVYFLFTYCIKIGWRHIIDVRKYVGVKGQGHFSFDSGLFFTLDFFQFQMYLFLNYYIIQRRGTCFLWTYRTRVWTQKTQGKDSPVAIAYSDKYTHWCMEIFLSSDWLSVFLKEKHFVRHKMWSKWQIIWILLLMGELWLTRLLIL